jgi:hypothetical protein
VQKASYLSSRERQTRREFRRRIMRYPRSLRSKKLLLFLTHRWGAALGSGGKWAISVWARPRAAWRSTSVCGALWAQRTHQGVVLEIPIYAVIYSVLCAALGLKPLWLLETARIFECRSQSILGCPSCLPLSLLPARSCLTCCGRVAHPLPVDDAESLPQPVALERVARNALRCEIVRIASMANHGPGTHPSPDDAIEQGILNLDSFWALPLDRVSILIGARAARGRCIDTHLTPRHGCTVSAVFARKSCI